MMTVEIKAYCTARGSLQEKETQPTTIITKNREKLFSLNGRKSSCLFHEM
jgi:hypothetical protein